MLMEFVERLNFKLPIDKRIKVIDCTQYQNYGIVTNQLILLYSKHFDGFPTTFIGNTKISGSNSRIEYETFLYGLLEDEFIVPEQNKHKFIKDCEYNKKGLFKGKVICK